jgi:hypothetical protein
MQQIKLRLDQDVLDHLKNQAKLQNVPFNTLCRKILTAAASETEVLLVSSHRLALQLDLVATSLRSLEKAVNSNK